MVDELRCPKCHSDKLVKGGISYWSQGKRQRYYCNGCHKYTAKPIIESKEDAAIVEVAKLDSVNK